MTALSTAYVHPTSGDFFFRPLGYIDYWLEYKWAGFDFFRWHMDGLLFHAAAIYLLFVLGRELNLTPWASSVAALLFGIHGTNPEAVFWTASRFDELATIFVLITLICVCEYTDKHILYLSMLASCLCAVVSKESAFCIPGLAICCLWFRGTLNKRGMRAVVGLIAVCAVAFGYRSWVIGGIGGYRDTRGAPSILHFNVLGFLEIVFFRMWGVLVFPINWSIRPELWTLLVMLLFIGAVAAAMTLSKPASRKIRAALAFCVIALLPALHLASLDARLTGSRVFHLATIGFALLIAAIYDGFSNKRLAVAASAGFLVFQCAALVHNLDIWRDTAYLAQRTCSAFARFSNELQPLVVLPLPRTHNGVFFLANGFHDCVYVNSGKQVTISALGAKSGEQDVFRWNEQSESIEKLKSR